MLARIRELLAIGKKSVIWLEVDKEAKDLEKYKGKDLDVNIKRYSAKRSLSQNAYYWELLTQVAEAVKTSTAYQHNKFLRVHPRFKTFDGKVVQVWLKEVDAVHEQTLEDTETHLYPTSHMQTNSNNTVWRCWYMLRGTKTYTVQEMNTLLEDLIDEAKQIGIDTATPAEVERMKQYDERVKHGEGQ